MKTTGRGARALTIGALGLLVGLGCAVPTATYAAGTTAAPAAATVSSPARVQRAVDDAAAYARARGYLVGIGVVDTTTGRSYTGGLGTAYLPAESSIKVMLAANLLARGLMSGSTATAARAMIQYSDDDATNALYWSAGGDGIVRWTAARYRISALGTGPTIGSGWWGSFIVSPLGFAQFLAAARRDPAVGPWLYRTMAGMKAVASDGTNQVFGLYAADPAGAIKQGWGGTWPGGGITMTPSVGWVRGGRYAVALFVGHIPRTSYAASMTVTTGAARVLLAGLT